MEALTQFWHSNRTELVVTAITIFFIHLITSGGGFVKRRGGARRVEGAGFKSSADGEPGPGR